MPPLEVSRPRRWVADPLALLGLLALVALALLVAPAQGPLLLLAVVVAGVSLSGST